MAKKYYVVEYGSLIRVSSKVNSEREARMECFGVGSGKVLLSGKNKRQLYKDLKQLYIRKIRNAIRGE